MRNSKLIIISGISGSGKSTTAQKLADQYERNGIEYIWLHEEIKNHPIRDGEFSIGSTYSKEDMEKNILDMYKRWEKLVEKIEKSSSVYIMEGCLYQNIIRYFFDCNYPIEKITEFYNSVMNIISKVNGTVVFLYRSDIRESFKKAFEVRGERWKNIILSPDYEGYFSKHKYVGDESIYKKWDEYQEIANSMFKGYSGYKIKLNTSGEMWDKYIKTLTEYLELDYKAEDNVPYIGIGKYLGKYGIIIGGKKYIIEIKSDAKKENLYCQSWFWSNMKMIPLGNNEFEILSFPIKLVFKFQKDKRTVEVKGTYGWALTGKTMMEI